MASERYTRTAIFLHWLIALLIVAAFTLGLVMTAIPGLTPTKLRYFSYHKSIGVTILLLACLRLLWRLMHAPPPLPPSVSMTEKKLANAVHRLLYLLMFAVPISGYAYSLASGVPVKFLGRIPLPVLMGPDPVLKPLLQDLHFSLNIFLAVCLALHIAGSIKHRVIDGENLVRRMWP
jgi:cytochrome b561